MDYVAELYIKIYEKSGADIEKSKNFDEYLVFEKIKYIFG